MEKKGLLKNGNPLNMSKIGKKGKIRFSLRNFIAVNVSKIGKKGNFVKLGFEKIWDPW